MQLKCLLITMVTLTTISPPLTAMFRKLPNTAQRVVDAVFFSNPNIKRQDYSSMTVRPAVQSPLLTTNHKRFSTSQAAADRYAKEMFEKYLKKDKVYATCTQLKEFEATFSQSHENAVSLTKSLVEELVALIKKTEHNELCRRKIMFSIQYLVLLISKQPKETQDDCLPTLFNATNVFINGLSSEQQDPFGKSPKEMGKKG